VIHGDLPAHLVTLAEYGPSIGRSAAYIKVHWRDIAGFPEPVGHRPGKGRHGGGRREPVYARDSLDAFRREHDSLWGQRSTRLIVGHDPAERVTLEEFAAICATCGVTPDPAGARGRPRADAGGRRRLGALIDWHNGLPAAAGPRLAVTPAQRDDWVTRPWFARTVGVHPTTVTQYQYRDEPGYPAPADDDAKLYRLGELADWWNGRPGKVPAAGERKGTSPARQAPGPGRVPGHHGAGLDDAGPRRRPRTATATAARVERALDILGARPARYLIATGQLRVAHPEASLRELGQLSDPPLTKDTVAHRLRRLLAMADERASDLGLPGTGA
jgi:hypothetical protein